MNQRTYSHLPPGQDQHLLQPYEVRQAETRVRICWPTRHPATVVNLVANQHHLLLNAGEPQRLVVVVHRLNVVAGCVRLVSLLFQCLRQHLVLPGCRLFRIELGAVFRLGEGGEEGDPLHVPLLTVLIVLPQVWTLFKADLTENLGKLSNFWV